MTWHWKILTEIKVHFTAAGDVTKPDLYGQHSWLAQAVDSRKGWRWLVRTLSQVGFPFDLLFYSQKNGGVPLLKTWDAVVIANCIGKPIDILLFTGRQKRLQIVKLYLDYYFAGLFHAKHLPCQKNKMSLLDPRWQHFFWSNVIRMIAPASSLFLMVIWNHKFI